MAPGDASELPAMLDFALERQGPCAIRYPKSSANVIERDSAPIELGRSETLRTGPDGCLIACGALLGRCVEAADLLRDEGLELTVINARFLKPLDGDTIVAAVRDLPWVVTVEESALAGGFGSAVLEAAADAQVDSSRLRRLGIPDVYIEHGERDELLADLGLDVAGIAATCRALAGDRNQTLASIRGGVADAEAGRVRSLSEVDADIREKLRLSPRK
jgi:1-deoxy-D-xylulose-5-phosphate synthase